MQSFFAKAQKSPLIERSFEAGVEPERPDYSMEKYWASLPTIRDFADSVPVFSPAIEGQETAQVDVFFVHPTIYTGSPKGEFLWNADVNDADLNLAVDQSTMLNQASAFNGACKVYAPRYRQAHYSAFVSEDTSSARKALDLAYTDVRAAFEFYMAHYNKGRPLVIASHSQGTVHAIRLLKEFFDGKALQNQLVEAYLVGMPVKPDEFEHILPSTAAAACGGFVTWNTFAKGYYPDYYEDGLDEAVCTNPITWTTDETYGSRFDNHGTIGRKFKYYEKVVDAQVHEGLLWIKKPHIVGRLLLRNKIWHIADINFYWMSIRENVVLRINSFSSQANSNER
ncbi:DUF3089 domain-containing protein [Marinilongibacter aquaticus]|uniref:DUF3089 domain-containing protein n=1 Tax=Marinilongibacter aquaticus TaxID=2975157 RepID=UPI0021BD0556|nr:DUF3089 domain-containing protein [Marinilongibacter aquaticus]UBM57374.1 DUF3089 domain-containing protein [Marinilongibacter aquaticus]